MKLYFYIIFIILGIVAYFQFKQNIVESSFEKLSDSISNSITSGTPFTNSFPKIKR